MDHKKYCILIFVTKESFWPPVDSRVQNRQLPCQGMGIVTISMCSCGTLDTALTCPVFKDQMTHCRRTTHRNSSIRSVLQSSFHYCLHSRSCTMSTTRHLPSLSYAYYLRHHFCHVYCLMSRCGYRFTILITNLQQIQIL